LLPDDQVHPDTHVLTMVNNVIGVVNYVIAARPSPLNFMIADIRNAEFPHQGSNMALHSPHRHVEPTGDLAGYEAARRPRRAPRPRDR
jgi:hypothetical protein